MSGDSYGDTGARATQRAASDVAGERRGGRRRTYNRRNDDKDVSPPYFEAFERIAVALESIEQVLRSRSVTLPDVESSARVHKT